MNKHYALSKVDSPLLRRGCDRLPTQIDRHRILDTMPCGKDRSGSANGRPGQDSTENRFVK